MYQWGSLWKWVGGGVAACCLSSAALADTDSLQIEAIDVEGGAAALYITPEHRSLLIDTGWTSQLRRHESRQCPTHHRRRASPVCPSSTTC